MECNKKKRERETETKYNKEACKNEGMRQKNQTTVKVKQRENNFKVVFFYYPEKCIVGRFLDRNFTQNRCLKVYLY